MLTACCCLLLQRIQMLGEQEKKSLRKLRLKADAKIRWGSVFDTGMIE